jgi:hypothetical protein
MGWALYPIAAARQIQGLHAAGLAKLRLHAVTFCAAIALSLHSKGDQANKACG